MREFYFTGIESRRRNASESVSRFIFKEDMDIYYRHRKQIIAAGEPQVCELRMVTQDGTIFWVHLKGNVSQEVPGAPVCRLIE